MHHSINEFNTGKHRERAILYLLHIHQRLNIYDLQCTSKLQQNAMITHLNRTKTLNSMLNAKCCLMISSSFFSFFNFQDRKKRLYLIFSIIHSLPREEIKAVLFSILYNLISITPSPMELICNSPSPPLANIVLFELSLLSLPSRF